MVTWWPMVDHACAFNGRDSRIRRGPSPMPFPKSKLKAKSESRSCKSKSSEHLVSTTCGTVQSVQSIQEQHLAPGKSTPPPPARQDNCAALLLAVPTPPIGGATLVMSNRLVLRTPYRTVPTVREALSCPALTP